MIKLAEAAERIAATTKKLEKIAIVAEYLKAHTPEEASVAAIFLSGRPFPVWEETTLQVGGRVLWRIVAELSGQGDAELTAAVPQTWRPWRRRGSSLSSFQQYNPRSDKRLRPSWPGNARRCLA